MPGPDDPIVESAAPAPAAIASAVPEAPLAQPDPAVVASTAAAEVPPTAAADAKPDFEPTLLDKFDADKDKPAEKVAETKPEEKPAEVKADEKPAEEKPAEKAEEDKPAEEVKGDAPTEKPVLEAVAYFDAETGVKIPETIKLDDASKADVTKAFDLVRTDPKAGAQALIDLHTKHVNSAVNAVSNGQWEAFRKTNADWTAATMADPVLGGAGHKTAMAKIALARDAFGSSHPVGSPGYEKDMAELNQALKITGAGNHPAILRMMHNASKFVREAALPPADPKPPADIGRAPGRKGKLNYTHPTSNPNP